MNNLLRFLRGHEPDVTALSARLDGQLDASAAARLDEHVASCDACRGVLDGLRVTREALRALPEAEASRSFRLRAADVGRAPVASARRGTDVVRWAPALGAVAAAAFVVVLAVDLRSNDGDTTKASAPNAIQQARPVDSSDSGGLAARKSAGDAGTTPAAGVAAPEQSPAATSPDRAQQPPGGVPPAPGPAGVASVTPTAALRGSEGYDRTAAGAAPMATATAALGDISAASAPAGGDGGGNNSTLLRVIEIIAGVTAVAAAVVVIVRRRRGDGV